MQGMAHAARKGRLPRRSGREALSPGVIGGDAEAGGTHGRLGKHKDGEGT